MSRAKPKKAQTKQVAIFPVRIPVELRDALHAKGIDVAKTIRRQLGVIADLDFCVFCGQTSPKKDSES